MRSGSDRGRLPTDGGLPNAAGFPGRLPTDGASAPVPAAAGFLELRLPRKRLIKLATKREGAIRIPSFGLLSSANYGGNEGCKQAEPATSLVA